MSESSTVNDNIPHDMRAMESSRGAGIVFTGDSGIGVREFLRWMESWFATQGEGFNGTTAQSKKRRVAQLHVACPIRSAAANFLRTLPQETLWNEEALTGALIEQFQGGEREGDAQEDILSKMSTLRQGDRNVFSYSRRVLKLLNRKPSGLEPYDKILVRYYINGLASKRVRDLATVSYLKPDSRETPYQAVRGVMRLAEQLKIKGYKSYIDANGDYDTSEDDEEDSDDDNDDDDDSDHEGSSSFYDSDAESDASGYRRTARKKKRFGKGKRSSQKREKRAKSKERKSRKGQDSEGSVRGEVRELKKMMRAMDQKMTALPNTSREGKKLEEDIIPLDTYALAEGYRRYPQPNRYLHEQPASGYSTDRHQEYPNRRGYVSQYADFNERRGNNTSSAYPSGQPPNHTRHQGSQRFAPTTGQQLGTYRGDRAYEGSPRSEPIIGPNGVLYYPARPRVCYHCQEEGHLRPQCPRLRVFEPPSRTVTLGPDDPERSINTRAEPPARGGDQPVNLIEIANVSSALAGVKVCEVTMTEVDPSDLTGFVQEITDEDDEEDDDDEYEDEGASVMAGERARRFSERHPEADEEAGPARQRLKRNDPEVAVGAAPEDRKQKAPVSRVPRKPIRLMAGREKFDFVGAFRDAPVVGLNWGSFFDLAPAVKKDICHLLVQERAKGLERAKGKKGKKVAGNVGIVETPEEEEVASIATDRGLGNVTNFYTKGIIRTKGGTYRISRILVDAGSVVNLMPIDLLRLIGAKLQKAGGMVIRTATNALAKIAFCADIRIAIADVACDLRVYALPEEYKPTYPLLLSRRWLQAVKAMGDYASGQYYVMSQHGTRIRIPSDQSYQGRDRKGKLPAQQPRVPIVLRDKNAADYKLSAEVEEELEWQRCSGRHFFEELVELIKQQADEQIRDEDDNDDENDDEDDDGTHAENSKN